MGSRLLRADGMMCCLGFAALAAGCQQNEILLCAAPDPTNPAGKALPEFSIDLFPLTNDTPENFVNREAPSRIILSANDNWAITDEQREAILKENGPKVGINFTFED